MKHKEKEMWWHWERWASSWNKCGHDGDSELFWEAECAVLINMVKSQPRSAAQAQKNILIIGESNWLRWRYIYTHIHEWKWEAATMEVICFWIFPYST